MGTSSGITTNGSTNITPLGYSFNATAGQSIIYYNGNQTGGDKVPHGLGVKPSLIIVKDVVDANSWNVYHVSNEKYPLDGCNLNHLKLNLHNYRARQHSKLLIKHHHVYEASLYHPDC